MKRTYHSKSWSQQAREMAQKQFEIYVFYTENSERWLFNVTPEQHAMSVFNYSYRHPLITTRAAGIFGRKVKEYKKKKGLAN